MTEQSDKLVRTQTFPVEGPLELDVSVTVGRVEIRLGEYDEASVEVRHDPSASAPWMSGVADVLSWVGEHFGQQLGTDFRSDPADAVQQTRVEKVGNRIVVHGPKPLQLRNVPLAVTVHAPAGSAPEVRAGAADVAVTGTAGRTDISTGSGDVTVERNEGSATIRTGTGAIRLGPAESVQLRTGSGSVEAAAVIGSATLATGTGDVRLGAVEGDVLVRSGSGGLSVAEAASGSIELITGSGDIRIGIRTGVRAEIRLSSGSGRVSSELDVADTPPEGEVPLQVRGRTGSGNAVVTTAR